MPTETITLRYNTFEAGGPITSNQILKDFASSTFQWTITNVGSTGTFVDGTPWIVMGSTGSFLTDISPRSYGITSTSNTAINVPPVFHYINGSAKNYHRHQVAYNKTTLAIENIKNVFDSRYLLMPSNQQTVNSTYGLTFNIGYTSGGTGAALNPVGLTFGDNIITADSFWVNPGDPIVGQSPETGSVFITFAPGTTAPEPLNGVAYQKANGNVIALRSVIKRYGIINVLQSAPTERCFRPPAQWKDSTTRPLIPVSHAMGVTAIANFVGYFNSNYSPYKGNIGAGVTSGAFGQAYDRDAHKSLVYYSGGGTVYQGYRGQAGMSNNLYVLLTEASTPYYFGSEWSALLAQMCNTHTPVKVREEARNRYIQAGIDAFGAVMSGTALISDGCHRANETLAPILITGWLLGSTYGNQMIDIYNTLRTEFSGLTGTSDAVTGSYFFKDFGQYTVVEENSTQGTAQRQTYVPWYSGIGSTFTYVTSAEEIGATEPITLDVITFLDFPIGGTTFGRGKYAKLNVAGGGIIADGRPARGFREYSNLKFDSSHNNYPGSYLKVTAGPGSGDAIYRIIKTGSLVIGSQYERAVDYVILDRPWINGLPTNQSTVEIYPFRNGGYAFDGSTADVGRHIFMVDPVSNRGWTFESLQTNRVTGLSPRAASYGSTSIDYAFIHQCFLKKLNEITGNQNFVKSNLFKHYTQNALGYHKDIHTQVPFSSTPREEYFLHLSRFLVGGAPDPTAVAFTNWVKGLVGFTGSTGYGNGTWTTIPGYTLQYNALGLAELLGNFGKPGRNDYNFNGATDAADMAWFLSKWGQ